MLILGDNIFDANLKDVVRRQREDRADAAFLTEEVPWKMASRYGVCDTNDYGEITDVVEENERLLSTDTADGETLNIGSSDNIDIKTLATAVREQVAPGLDIEYAERHDADADHTHADVSKAREVLDYDPDHTIREGVGKFIEWYRENRDWYEPLVRAS